MADAKGVYFGPSNTGFATILPDKEKPGVLDYALKLEGQKQRQNQLRQKQAQDGLKDLKNFETWRYYTPGVNQKYSELISDIRKGGMDPVTMKMRTNELATLSQTSLQLQDEYKAAQQQYKQDKKVTGAEEWYIKKYHSNPSVDNLSELQTQGLDNYAFLEEQGGSKYINSTEAFKDVVNTAFKDFIKQKDETDPSRRYIGRGLQQVTQEQFEAEFRSFAQIDESTGEIAVKNIDALIDDGVLNVFMQDPYTKRILEDQAQARAGGKRSITDDDRAAVLKEMLSPRTGGKVSNTKSFTTARENNDTGRTSGAAKAQTATEWLKKARQADQDAWAWVEGGKYKGRDILGASVIKGEDGKPSGKIQLNFAPDDNSSVSNPNNDFVVFDLLNASKEQLLKLYSSGKKKSETEFNSVEDLNMKDIMDPNLNTNIWDE